MEKLVVCPHNPRKRDFDLDELTESIKERDIQEVIEVHPYGDVWHIMAGHRRFLAAEKAGRTEVECLEYQLDEDQAEEWCMHDAFHKKGYHPLDLTDLAVKAVEKYGSISKASDATGISQSKLKKYHGMRSLAKEVRDKIGSPGTSKPPVEILRKVAQLPKPTQVGAYEAVKGKTRSQAEGILAKIRDKIEETTIKEVHEDIELIPIQVTNVWYFPRCDERFGFPNPMRLPGQVVQNLLYFWSKEGDVVLDPMAGSGTTIDVCKSMGRKSIAYDQIPLRPDIEQNDMTKGIPLEDSSVDLVVLDPPYWNMKEGYSDSESDLANMSLEDFLRSMKWIRDECYRVLREGGYVAFLMAPRKLSKNELIPLTSEVLGIFRERFSPVERIVLVKDIHSKQTPGFNVQRWRAREYKYLLRGFVDLVVMEKKPTG